jgi:hypothetical protein
MKPYLAPLAILLITSFVVGGIAADGHSVPKPGWNKLFQWWNLCFTGL